jgi:hypothetical protein
MMGLAAKKGGAMDTLSMWNQTALEKARAFDLAKKLSELLARHYPYLGRHIKRIVERLLPVRLSHGGRQLRAWGRDFRIKPEETMCIKRLVKALYQGTKVVELPIESFRDNQALILGTIATDGRGGFWMEEPEEEKMKPVLVILPEIKKKLRLKCELALACLMKHPEWTDAQIADHIGCSRTAMYRWQRYNAAREMLQNGRNKYQSDS